MSSDSCRQTTVSVVFKSLYIIINFILTIQYNLLLCSLEVTAFDGISPNLVEMFYFIFLNRLDKLVGQNVVRNNIYPHLVGGGGGS